MDINMYKPIALGVVTVTIDNMVIVHDVLSLIALLVPTLYTLWRWIRDTRKNHPPNKFQEKG